MANQLSELREKTPEVSHTQPEERAKTIFVVPLTDSIHIAINSFQEETTRTT